jgi:uncharacterized repeat protein (TIGR02543 family)
LISWPLTVTASRTLYAQWTAVQTGKCTVTFESEGGSAVASVTVDSGGTVAKPSPDPTRNGYTFAGWYSAASGGSAISWPLTVTGDTTLYAQWLSGIGVTTPAEPGDATITLSGSLDSATSAAHAVSLSWQSGDTLQASVSNSTDFSDFAWYVDGVVQNEYSSAFTIQARNFGLGTHGLTIITTLSSDNKRYARTVWFKVAR